MITESRANYGAVGTRVLSVTAEPVAGEQAPIVCLHGFADSADTWQAVLELLEGAGRSAIAVDLPGFGHAERLAVGPIMPQLEAFAEAVVAEHAPVVLVGNSIGAAVAVRAAARDRQKRIQALVTLNEPSLADHRLARLARCRDHRRLMSVVGALPLPRPALRRAVRWAVPRYLYGPTHPAEPAVVARWAQTVSDAHTLARLGRDAVGLARETRDGYGDIAVDCPALVVHGARDRIIPVAASRGLHELLPHSELVVLPTSGHCPQLDDPGTVTELILDVLGPTSGHTASTGGTRSQLRETEHSKGDDGASFRS